MFAVVTKMNGKETVSFLTVLLRISNRYLAKVELANGASNRSVDESSFISLLNEGISSAHVHSSGAFVMKNNKISH